MKFVNAALEIIAGAAFGLFVVLMCNKFGIVTPNIFALTGWTG